jgi:hypothetical protein
MPKNLYKNADVKIVSFLKSSKGEGHVNNTCTFTVGSYLYKNTSHFSYKIIPWVTI